MGIGMAYDWLGPTPGTNETYSDKRGEEAKTLRVRPARFRPTPDAPSLRFDRLRHDMQAKWLVSSRVR